MTDSVVHFRVVRAYDDFDALLKVLWHVPWVMNVVVGHVFKLRTPCADVLALWIEFL